MHNLMMCVFVMQDKHERMKAAVKYYLEGDDNALKGFPGGSEPGT
jgi:hypothetical protein